MDTHIATGQMPDSEGVIFTAASKVVITNIQIISVGADPNQDVRLSVDRTGTPLTFWRVLLESQWMRGEWSGRLVLESGEELLGESTDDLTVNYFIDGYEAE